MTSIFEGQAPKTRPNFQSPQGAPFGFQEYKQLHEFPIFFMANFPLPKPETESQLQLYPPAVR